MSAVVNAALPVFALILLGYFVSKRRLLAVDASTQLNAFVVWLALPALMFHVMASVTWEQLNQVPFILTNLISLFGVYFLFMVWQRRHLHLTDNSLASLAASYSNTGYMGLPLCLLAYGKEGALPAIISMVMTAFVLFAVAVVFAEIGMHRSASIWVSLRKVAISLIKNPILVAPTLGAIVSALGWKPPLAIMNITKILGDAASPCALVTIGLFLAQTRNQKFHRLLVPLLTVKMLILPIVTAILAYWVFTMPPMYRETAVLLASLPTGTGPFMLAMMYRRETELVSQSIFVSTLISAVTVSILLVIFHIH